MERRREHRFVTDQPVELVLLGAQPGDDVSVPARLLNLSGRGLSLLCERQIPVGVPIRVNLNATVLLGELCHCTKADGGYLCGIRLEQALTSVGDLSQLMNAVIENISSKQGAIH
jgi:hypothetical protein